MMRQVHGPCWTNKPMNAHLWQVVADCCQACTGAQLCKVLQSLVSGSTLGLGSWCPQAPTGSAVPRRGTVLGQGRSSAA